ncbi:DNA-binding domain-containing protein [Sedimenticola sp.]|uniref:HvfC/BufC N-terminal domain-containing protein n=1 Tax=Sedimenticola sp. TaxID=1940285 RepID=UPI003D0BAF25
MPRLSDLQQQFCDALRSAEAPPAALLDMLVDDGLALQRFNVYRNNFVVLNGDALADMYPVIKQLVGDEAFRTLATAYVRQYPPQERSLLLYGDRFAQFLGSIPELSALPYLADVARIEFAWTDAYHAEECAPLTEQQVAAIAPERFAQARLVPHPSLHCIRSDYPIFHIWQANQSADNDETVSLDEGASLVWVIRPSQDVEVREVSAAACGFMQALQSGHTIEQAVTDALALDSRFDLSALLARHLFDGTFCDIHPAPDGAASEQ